MSNVLSYRGYYATVEFDSEEGLLCGSVVGMSDGVYFEVETAAGVESAFHEAVDDYLSFCKEKGKQPEKDVYKRQATGCSWGSRSASGPWTAASSAPSPTWLPAGARLSS